MSNIQLSFSVDISIHLFCLERKKRIFVTPNHDSFRIGTIISILHPVCVVVWNPQSSEEKYKLKNVCKTLQETLNPPIDAVQTNVNLAIATLWLEDAKSDIHTEKRKPAAWWKAFLTCWRVVDVKHISWVFLVCLFRFHHFFPVAPIFFIYFLNCCRCTRRRRWRPIDHVLLACRNV